ncbi:hypothetical protein MRB53_016468 [Persea americana]|uniref:Uncharacterized protein n=1 Tax=Persea americana TaxID=3435 RepID=A0ACC2M245_PERAE|nr:hypothetical protein MRB53_016468 [Persea americana]
MLVELAGLHRPTAKQIDFQDEFESVASEDEQKLCSNKDCFSMANSGKRTPKHCWSYNKLFMKVFFQGLLQETNPRMPGKY